MIECDGETEPITLESTEKVPLLIIYLSKSVKTFQKHLLSLNPQFCTARAKTIVCLLGTNYDVQWITLLYG